VEKQEIKTIIGMDVGAQDVLKQKTKIIIGKIIVKSVQDAIRPPEKFTKGVAVSVSIVAKPFINLMNNVSAYIVV